MKGVGYCYIIMHFSLYGVCVIIDQREVNICINEDDGGVIVNYSLLSEPSTATNNTATTSAPAKYAKYDHIRPYMAILPLITLNATAAESASVYGIEHDALLIKVLSLGDPRHSIEQVAITIEQSIETVMVCTVLPYLTRIL